MTQQTSQQMSRHDPERVVRAPTGTQLTCKSWLTEAAFSHAAKQSRPGGGRAPVRSGGIWRHRACSTQLGIVRRHSGRAQRCWKTTNRC